VWPRPFESASTADNRNRGVVQSAEPCRIITASGRVIPIDHTFKTTRRVSHAILLTTLLACLAARVEAQADPLPSWNDGSAKSEIVTFVARVTKAEGPDFVAPAERIAVFDNDGTLWPENPMPFELAFVIDQIRSEAPEHPEWKDQQPYKAVLEGDVPGLVSQGKAGIIELVMATHAGMTTDEFDASVSDWVATAKHPRFDRLYTDLAYRPMLEGGQLHHRSGDGKDGVRPQQPGVIESDSRAGRRATSCRPIADAPRKIRGPGGASVACAEAEVPRVGLRQTFNRTESEGSP
jgi:hypothetical protein